MRGLAARFGRELAGDAAFGAVRLTGTGTVSLTAINLDTASVELDGNVGEGRLGLDTSGERRAWTARWRSSASTCPSTQGNSASCWALPRPARRVALAPVAAAGRVEPVRSGSASLGHAIALGPLSGGPGGLSLRLREGDLSLDLSETAVAGGTVELAGRLKPDRESGLLHFSMKMIADNLAAETLPRPEALPEILSGRVNGRLERVGQGASVEEVLASAKTMASIALVDARFRDAEPAALFQRLTGNGDTSAPGSGVFERIDIQGDVGEDAMRLDRVTAETAGHVLTASGRMSLPDMALSLRGYLTKRPAEAPGGEGPGDGSGTPGGDEGDPQTPVLLRGTLGEPRLLPDLMRSDDASPPP